MIRDNYEWILNVISYLWSEAKEIHCQLYKKDQDYTKLIDEAKSDLNKVRLWPLKKLLVLAGYAPMFLRIIFAQWKEYGRDKFYCSSTCFVDTHAGFGIDVIGAGDDEVTLGSALISLLWPKHVSENVKSFINLGKEFRGPYFDLYMFNDIDETRIKALHKILSHVIKANNISRSIGENIRLSCSDANKYLKNIVETLKNKKCCSLVFVDPPGEASAHIKFKVLQNLASNLKVLDLIVVFHDGSLSRAIAKDVSVVQSILSTNAYQQLCNAIKRGEVQNALVEAYTQTLHDAGFKKVKVFSVTYVAGSKPIYHVYVATKDEKAQWLEGFEEWYRSKRRIEGMSYEKLKGYWVLGTGKAKTLLDYSIKSHTKKQS